MSEDQQDRFEMPKEMRSMAEASFDQARKGFEQFVAGAQQTTGSIEERGATVRAGAKDISAKAISYAEQNVQASLDYAQALLHAKDLTEVMRLNSRICADADARAGRAGERNGPDCQPRRDRGRQAEGVTAGTSRRLMLIADSSRACARDGVCHAALHHRLHCIAQN